MYSKEDFHRDVKRIISMIYVVSDQLSLGALAEEFISECDHPGDNEYWKQVSDVAKHDQDKFRLMLINHFTEWAMAILELPVVPWPETESRGPSLRRKYDAAELEALHSPDPLTHREAREERESVAAEEERRCVAYHIIESLGVTPIQYTQNTEGPIAIRVKAHVFLRAIEHERLPRDIIEEYIAESEHQDGFDYWHDSFYIRTSRRFNFGEMLIDVILYADIALEMRDHPAK